jgi:hypothetical protein
MSMIEIINNQGVVVSSEVVSATTVDVVGSNYEVIEVFERGKQGPKGDQGEMGVGAIDGDLIRWNAETQEWEAKQEPFEFKGIVLTPQETAIIEQEGALYYSNSDKSLKLCVGD